jgi:ATP-dependent Clp protease ATP-binding subunit ClpX
MLLNIQGGRKNPRGEFIQMDTTNILFICGGAFSGLETVIRRRVSHSSIGFGAKLRATATDELDQGALFDQVEPDDLVRFGLIPEFIGRFPVVISTKSLDVDQMVAVISEPKNALLKQYVYQFAVHNVDLHCTAGALRKIAEIAMKKNTGARGLKCIFEKLLTNAMFVIPDSPDCHTVLLDEAAVAGERSVLLLQGDLTLESYLARGSGVPDSDSDQTVKVDDRIEEINLESLAA